MSLRIDNMVAEAIVHFVSPLKRIDGHMFLFPILNYNHRYTSRVSEISNRYIQFIAVYISVSI